MTRDKFHSFVQILPVSGGPVDWEEENNLKMGRVVMCFRIPISCFNILASRRGQRGDGTFFCLFVIVDEIEINEY